MQLRRSATPSSVALALYTGQPNRKPCRTVNYVNRFVTKKYTMAAANGKAAAGRKAVAAAPAMAPALALA